MERAKVGGGRGDAPTDGRLLVHRLLSRLNVGGPAMHVVHLTRGLDDGRPFRTRLIVGRIEAAEGDMSWFARERGVEPLVVPTLRRSLHPVDDLRSVLALFRLFRRERPTIVHTHTSKAGFLGRVAAWLARVPVRIHTYHGHVLGGEYFSGWKTRFFRSLERLAARLTDRLVVLTEAQKREMTGTLEVAPEEKFDVIPLGLELERFAGVDRERVRPESRHELGLDEDHVVVGIVGRLVRVKNHELLFDAVPRLVTLLEEGVRELRILVVGSGEREHELLEYARTLEVEDRIQWLGWRRDLPRLYPAMDVLALTSHDEGTPVAVIEAMAARTPVVARDVGGVGEVLEDGRWGALVEWPDPAELAERIARAVMDPPPPEQLEAASRSARGRFAVERMVEDVKALYLRELR